MKLLVITQKVDRDDSVLGFFIGWLEKFAEKLEKVLVICLSEGKHQLPANVAVFSLGKEKGFSKARQFFRLQKFLWRYLEEVDGVFVHMCPIYAIVAWPLAKIFRKKMVLWYVHRVVPWELKLAEKLVDKIFTASEESCRLENRSKIEAVGHGIDIDKFKIQSSKLKIEIQNSKLKILYAGRIAPIKGIEILVETVAILVREKRQRDIEAKLVGEAVDAGEKRYFEELRSLLKNRSLENYFNFVSATPFEKMPEVYQESDVLVNLCPTGGLDKVVLEAMACGLPVLTSNQNFSSDFGEYAQKMLVKEKDAADLAEKILALRNETIQASSVMADYLREQVVKHHNLDNLVNKIITVFAK